MILPVLDEAEALPWVLERMPPGLRPIVVDNGSSDGSAGSRGLGARVIEEPARGFGAACLAGLEAAPQTSSASWTATARSTRRAARVSARSPTGAPTSSSGPARQRGAWPWHARLANRAAGARAATAHGVALTDLGPMRAARRDALLELGIADRRFGWPLEMVMRAAAAGWRIAEVAVPYRPRGGALEGDRHRARDRCARSATWRAVLA